MKSTFIVGGPKKYDTQTRTKWAVGAEEDGVTAPKDERRQ